MVFSWCHDDDDDDDNDIDDDIDDDDTAIVARLARAAAPLAQILLHLHTSIIH
jgi:hypothetical protein